MKRNRLFAQVLSVALMIAAVLALPVAGLAAEIKDVTKEHWAYQAVKTLVDRGYLAVYGDGTFHGGNSVDRYTLAVVIARILNEIETGRVGATPEDVELLRKLSGEFREELVAVSTDIGILRKSLDEQARAQTVMREDLAKLTFTQRDMRSEVQAMIDDIAAAAEKRVAEASAKAEEASRKLEARVGGTEKSIAELASRTETADRDLAARIDQSQGHIERLASEIDKGLENAASSLNDLAARMVASDARLSLRLDDHDASVSQLATGLDAAILRLTALEPEVSLIGRDLAAAKGEFAQGQDALMRVQDTLEAGLSSARSEIVSLGQGLDDLSARAESEDARLGKDIAALGKDIAALEGRTSALEEGLAVERTARITTDNSLQSGLADLASDLAAHKAQAAKDIDSLRKENGLLKVLLGVVAVLGFVL